MVQQEKRGDYRVEWQWNTNYYSPIHTRRRTEHTYAAQSTTVYHTVRIHITSRWYGPRYYSQNLYGGQILVRTSTLPFTLFYHSLTYCRSNKNITHLSFLAQINSLYSFFVNKLPNRAVVKKELIHTLAWYLHPVRHFELPIFDAIAALRSTTVIAAFDGRGIPFTGSTHVHVIVIIDSGRREASHCDRAFQSARQQLRVR